MAKSFYSMVLEQPASQVWDVVRDFNSYPIWVNGVNDSRIEEDLSGTSVGAIRDFSLGGARTRQRLLAHSDVNRFFTYESCGQVATQSGGTSRTLLHYQGTLQIRSIIDGDRTYAEWSSEYECPPQDAEYWSRWWAESLPTWLSSLRDHLDAPPSTTCVR